MLSLFILRYFLNLKCMIWLCIDTTRFFMTIWCMRAIKKILLLCFASHLFHLKHTFDDRGVGISVDLLGLQKKEKKKCKNKSLNFPEDVKLDYCTRSNTRICRTRRDNVTQLYRSYLWGGAVSAGCSRLPRHAGAELCRTLDMPPLLFLAGGSEAHPLEHLWERLTFGTKYNKTQQHLGKI